MKQRIWFERLFDLGLAPEVFPELLERIRGTPARLEEWVRRAPPEILTDPGAHRAWSVQEHVGHFGDLESLWAGRLEELMAGSPDLRPADLENRATHEAGHNAAGIDALLGRFREERETLVRRLEGLTDEDLVRTAQHPRLGQPMTVVDLFFFVAEHDDHHLATIGARVRGAGPTSTTEGSTHG